MAKFLVIAASILSIISFQNGLNALKCYECSNFLGGQCETVNDTMIKECDNSTISCYKLILKGKPIIKEYDENKDFCILLLFSLKVI